MEERQIHDIEGRSFYAISNRKRTQWSPIRSVITRVITKWEDHALQTELDETKSYYQLIIEITISEE